jgi:hypothetical protein
VGGGLLQLVSTKEQQEPAEQPGLPSSSAQKRQHGDAAGEIEHTVADQVLVRDQLEVLYVHGERLPDPNPVS